jgi:hypothetical protein
MSAAAVVGVTPVWFVFECVGYSLPSFLSNALLLVTILFFWEVRVAAQQVGYSVHPTLLCVP